MAKKEELKKGAGAPDVAEPTMEDFLKESGLADEFEADKSLTFVTWKPEVGEARAFEFLGMEDRQGELDGKMTTFQIHYAKDLKTGKEFSFIGGGLFSYIIREKKIGEGTLMAARYLGMVDLDNNQRAKQWEIRLLKSVEKKGKK